LNSALVVVRDMFEFLAHAEEAEEVEEVEEDGIRRETDTYYPMSTGGKTDEWHPYAPFQLSSSKNRRQPHKDESTRIKSTSTSGSGGGGGGGARSHFLLSHGDTSFDALRYWTQFSDFYTFPGIEYFESIPDLLCKLLKSDTLDMAMKMSEYNEKTLKISRGFWSHAFKKLLLNP